MDLGSVALFALKIFFSCLCTEVYNAELILIGVLKQSLDYSQYAFILD